MEGDLDTKRVTATAKCLVTLLDEDGPGAIAIAATSLRAADLAAVFEVLDEKQRLSMFVALPPDVAGNVLEELRPELRDQLLEGSDDNRLLKILAEADADDAVYFLDHLDDERAGKLLAQMDVKLRAQLAEQYELPDNCAGRIMKADVVTLRSFITAGQAFQQLQALKIEDQQNTALYIIDAESRLVGTLGFRKLVLAPPSTPVSALMDKDPIAMPLETDREAVARTMQKYHLLAVPVIDAERRIHGVITWDDAVDVLEAEAEKDLLAIAGTSESFEDNHGILKRTRLRMPWLVITAIGGFINASMITKYGASLNTQALLIGFMPLVGAMGGNIGIQCSTVTVRGLATGVIGPGRGLASVGREFGTGMVLALAMSLICGLGGSLVALSSNASAVIGAIMGISLLLVVMLASLLGVLVPLTCQRFRFDPALAAGPFITMLNDVVGNLVYISTVYVMLGLL